MALRSLLFSRDPEIISRAGEVLKTLDIEVSQCSGAQEAVRRLAETKFDAIIVDNADTRGAVAVLWAAKSMPSCEASAGIVLAVSPSSLGLADGALSHMVLYRPLSAERLRNGIKSALKLRKDNEDARESRRAAIEIPATLRGAALEDTLVFVTNLSPGGAALRLARSVPSSSIQKIEFSLPGLKDNVAASVELVWRDVQGSMGIRFVDMGPACRESLEKWLAAQAASPKVFKAGV
ncbi:MAG TPA: PilZ domain-containing protein [Terriglobales bacterium]|nr:PilZ domain-containing protein [Terriglobales bacterium]